MLIASRVVLAEDRTGLEDSEAHMELQNLLRPDWLLIVLSSTDVVMSDRRLLLIPVEVTDEPLEAKHKSLEMI